MSTLILPSLLAHEFSQNTLYNQHGNLQPITDRASTIIKYIAPLMLCLASINDALPNDISPTYGTSPAETARPKCRPRPASKPKCHRRQRRPLKYNTDNTRKVSLKSDTRPQQKPPQQKPPVEVVRPPPQRQLPTPGASLASVDPDLSSMEKQYLDAHNQYRARHRNTGALKWSDRIKQTAQRVANTCKFEHSGTPGVGENIAWGTFNPSTIAKDTTKMYYDEIRHYTPWFGREPRGEFSTYGHFTQVIWAGTTELGCAHANCGNGRYFSVCQYGPPGNVGGGYSANVNPLK